MHGGILETLGAAKRQLVWTFGEVPIMRKSLSIAAVTLLVSSIFPANATAQDLFRWNTNFGMHRMFGAPYGLRQDFRRGSFGREQRISQEITRLRANIDRDLANGDISEGRAERLNFRLNNIAARASAMASAGGLSLSEFAMLQARLNDVRVAVNGSAYY